MTIIIRHARIEDAPILAAIEQQIAKNHGELVSLPSELVPEQFALVICDNPDDFDTSTIEADHILILPDNGRRNPGQEIPKGSYSVSFS